MPRKEESSGLAPHPRLLIGTPEIGRLSDVSTPMLASAADVTRRAAREFARGTEFAYDETHHNAHLVRARIMQGRVVTLLVEHLRTGKRRFRDAVMEHVRAMGRWQYWSWITWRKGDARPDAIFDLSYGENCATLALAYDLLHDTLSADERQEFVDIARSRPVASFLAHAGKDAWWFGCPASNWNTVCAGGAGMLALAMCEQLPESETMLALAEQSVAPYMRTLDRTGGAWEEGIGYWNYGFRYAFLYLLSHQRATEKRHPLLKSKAVRKTLQFPLDFTPGGACCSFGDVNRWSPAPFHFAAAEALGCPSVLDQLRARMCDLRYRDKPQGWAEAAEMLLMYPRRKPRGPHRAQKNVRRLYNGQDWALLADRWPAPRLALTIRGGTTEVHHGHLDLLSFHCAVDGEALISNVTNREYLDTTFGRRRWDLFEMTPPAKNTLLVNGVGIANPSRVTTQPITIQGYRGIRIDASDAMGYMRDGNAVRFCGRLFLLLDGPAALVVDSLFLPHFGRIEARMHSEKEVTLRKRGAVLRGDRATLRVAYGAAVPAKLWSAVGAPTTPAKGATMLRWCTEDLVGRAAFATLMTPGTGAATVDVAAGDGILAVTAKIHGRQIALRLTHRLKAASG